MVGLRREGLQVRRPLAAVVLVGRVIGHGPGRGNRCEPVGDRAGHVRRDVAGVRERRDGERRGEDVLLGRAPRGPLGLGRRGSGTARLPDQRDDLVERRPPECIGVHRLDQDRPQPSRCTVEPVLTSTDAVHDRHRRSGAEGRPAERGEGHGRRPGVHVGCRGGVVAVQQLGREVAGRAEQPAGVGEPGVVGDPRESEVDEDRRPALQQHVGGLHVAVEYAVLVNVPQALRERRRQMDEVVTPDRALLADLVVQGEPRHVARGDIRDVAPRVGVDDLGHPARADAPEAVDLPRESLPCLVVADDVRPQHLERHPVAARPLSQVDDPHPALADPGQQPVAIDVEARRRPAHGHLGAGLAGHETKVAAPPREPGFGATGVTRW